MATIIIPYKPREYFITHLHNREERFIVLCCHRRAGKTVATINHLIRSALTTTDGRFAYIAPFYSMAKNIAWDILKKYSIDVPGIKINESELSIDYPNGSRIRLYGSDNPDALRGIGLDGVVFDEFAMQRPQVWTEIIRPALSDKKGYAIWIGTPLGKNTFYDIYTHAEKEDNWYAIRLTVLDTKIIDSDEIEDAKKTMSEDEFMQEFYCSWEAAIKGAFYAKEIEEARKNNKICKVEYDPNIVVNTYWDIGYSDDTAIIFTQRYGKELRIIDAYSNSGMSLGEYVSVLLSKGYKYGTHYFPWDARIKKMSDGKSTIDIAREYGLTVDVSPSLSVQEGIQEVRRIFNQCWFDSENCEQLLNAISQYKREYDDKRQTFRQTPLHDWTSHYADALRYMAICQPNKVEDDQEYKQAVKQYINSIGDPTGWTPEF